jgi:hypothetical protein
MQSASGMTHGRAVTCFLLASTWGGALALVGCASSTPRQKPGLVRSAPLASPEEQRARAEADLVVDGRVGASTPGSKELVLVVDDTDFRRKRITVPPGTPLFDVHGCVAGLKQGDPVAVFARRSPDGLVAIGIKVLTPTEAKSLRRRTAQQIVPRG